MTGGAHHKVKAGHLQRHAYLYVRQSTLRQVFENTESTKRQYGLRQHAVALGWPIERILVIDSDLGQSGASAADREGFQKLVTEVVSAKPALCSAWKYRVWRETQWTGTGCWRSVL
jgi:DNA invertase Pin-like site-specific DNA recombinase